MQYRVSALFYFKQSQSIPLCPTNILLMVLSLIIWSSLSANWTLFLVTGAACFCCPVCLPSLMFINLRAAPLKSWNSIFMQTSFRTDAHAGCLIENLHSAAVLLTFPYTHFWRGNIMSVISIAYPLIYLFQSLQFAVYFCSEHVSETTYNCCVVSFVRSFIHSFIACSFVHSPVGQQVSDLLQYAV